MASAKKETKLVTKLVETQVHVVTYALELSLDEVKTLRAILNHVGGSPQLSPRRHADAISNAIDDAVGKGHYDWSWAAPETGLLSKALYFSDYGSTDEAE